jgi:hypothetical protein
MARPVPVPMLALPELWRAALQPAKPQDRRPGRPPFALLISASSAAALSAAGASPPCRLRNAPASTRNPT